jgi:hypothetical protein
MNNTSEQLRAAMVAHANDTLRACGSSAEAPSKIAGPSVSAVGGGSEIRALQMENESLTLANNSLRGAHECDLDRMANMMRSLNKRDATIEVQRKTIAEQAQRIAAQNNVLSDIALLTGNENIPDAEIVVRVRGMHDALREIMHIWQTQSEACADNSRTGELMAERARTLLTSFQNA